MDSLASQLTADIGRNSALNNQLSVDLKERLKLTTDTVSRDSMLFKQLVSNNEMCGTLHTGLESAAPQLSSLASSIDGLEEKESGMIQQLEALRQTLAEPQSPRVNPSAEARHHAMISELRREVQDLSSRLNTATADLEAKDAESEKARHCLSEAKDRSQTAENRAAQLDAEVAALQDNIKAAELKVREELNRASVISRDRTKAKFEQQLHKVLKEKAEINSAYAKAKEQLAGVQQSLVRLARCDGRMLTL